MKVKSATFDLMGANCYLIVDEKTNQSALVDCTEFNEDIEKLIGDTDLKYILLIILYYILKKRIKMVK